MVQGHNNSIENLVAKKVEVCGHNNQISDIFCMHNISDSGQSNKIRNKKKRLQKQMKNNKKKKQQKHLMIKKKKQQKQIMK